MPFNTFTDWPGRWPGRCPIVFSDWPGHWPGRCPLATSVSASLNRLRAPDMSANVR